MNTTKSRPYAANTLDGVLSSHAPRHLPLHGAEHFLSEVYRCLVQGGVIRISVPYLDAHIRIFDAKKSMNWVIFFEADQGSDRNVHHFMYTSESLSALLRAGGSNVFSRRECRQDLEKLDNRLKSLPVEAIK